MGEFTQALAGLRGGALATSDAAGHGRAASGAGAGAGAAGSEAVGVLFRSTYADLKLLAHRRLARAGQGAPIDTTSLVHESYLRFLGAGRIDLVDRGHFLAYASKVMRSVIVDLVRQRIAERRGGGQVLLTLGTSVRDEVASDAQLLQIDEALQALAKVDPQLVEVVELRYFAGLSVDQVADVLGTSPRSVFRMWEKARLLLYDALSPP